MNGKYIPLSHLKTRQLNVMDFSDMAVMLY